MKVVEKYMCDRYTNCSCCMFSDRCNFYNGIAPYNRLKVNEVVEVSMALCEGRHSIPEAEDGSIFGKEVDPLNVDGMEREARTKLFKMGVTHLNLYVTGLTVALVAVLNACRRLEITIVLYHYDRENGTYYR